jgi:hypothetical protein
MAAREKVGVEVLVHSAAPSRARDDTRYRAQATAYLDFSPANRIHLLANEDRDSLKLDEGAASQLQEELGDVLDEFNPPNPSIASGTEVARRIAAATADIPLASKPLPFSSFGSPQASFNSILDNFDSPPVRGFGNDPNRRVIEPGYQAHDSDSWEPPPGTLSDSQPDDGPYKQNLLSPAAVLEHYQQIRKESDIPPSPLLGQALVETPEYSRSRVSGLESGPRTRSAGAKAHHRNISSTSVVNASAEQATFSSAGGQSEAQQRQTSLISSTNLLAPITSGKASNSTGTSRRCRKVRDTNGELLEIRSVAPTSNEKLDAKSLITPPLAQLAEQLSLPIRFKPLRQSRPLRPMERGYWHVNCSSWGSELKDEFWKFLEAYLEKGLAGWGVWCMKDIETDSVRMYCWGEIVGHIYLLLYMVSQRKVKGSGAKWIDGEGLAVITMPTE